MKKIVVLLLLSVTLMFAQEHKVVFDLSTSSQTVLKKSLIKNVEKLREYYSAKGDTLKVAVVISGGAYKFFVEDIFHSPYYTDVELYESFARRTQMLEKFSQNADIEVCSIGMKKRGIDESTLYPFVIPAFNKTEALIRYQNAGYAYIPIL